MSSIDSRTSKAGKPNAAGTPELDSLDLTMSLAGRTERLSEVEYLLLEQMIAFREQQLSGESLKDVVGLKPSAPDRIIEKAMAQLIRKTNALFPTFPLVRRVSRNAWLYTEVAPKVKPGQASLDSS